MSTTVLIIGESGRGKSTSIENLNPKETFIINVQDKGLPFKGWKNKYKQEKGVGNLLNVKRTLLDYRELTEPQCIINALEAINIRPEIKTLIIDDFQALITNEFLRRATDGGYNKFSELAQTIHSIISRAAALRDDLIVVFMAHSQTDDSGVVKCKTVGKMLDAQVCIEGMFLIVFDAIYDPANEFTIIADKESGKVESGYLFRVNTDGKSISKSPKGMFNSKYIANDLKYVVDKINEYNNDDIQQ